MSVIPSGSTAGWSRRLALTTCAIALLTGCGTLVDGSAVRSSASPVNASTPAMPTAPVAAVHTLSGAVSEAGANGARPVVGASVSVWVQQAARGFHLGSFTTDAAGRYSVSGIPDSFVVLYAGNREYRQPRAATMAISGDAVLDIEIVKVGTETFPADPNSSSAALYGVVYEQTPQGRRPVPGASVEVEWTVDLLTATTTTDANGRYWLGDLPKGSISIAAVGPNFKPGSPGAGVLMTFSGTTSLDLEIAPPK